MPDRSDKFTAGAFGPLRDVRWIPCFTCAHIRTFDADGDPATCAAFPDGIPETIRDGRNDHSAPVPGDHGITYSPR